MTSIISSPSFRDNPRCGCFFVHFPGISKRLREKESSNHRFFFHFALAAVRQFELFRISRTLLNAFFFLNWKKGDATGDNRRTGPNRQKSKKDKHASEVSLWTQLLLDVTALKCRRDSIPLWTPSLPIFHISLFSFFFCREFLRTRNNTPMETQNRLQRTRGTNLKFKASSWNSESWLMAGREVTLSPSHRRLSQKTPVFFFYSWKEPACWSKLVCVGHRLCILTETSTFCHVVLAGRGKGKNKLIHRNGWLSRTCHNAKTRRHFDITFSQQKYQRFFMVTQSTQNRCDVIAIC